MKYYENDNFKIPWIYKKMSLKQLEFFISVFEKLHKIKRKTVKAKPKKETKIKFNF